MPRKPKLVRLVDEYELDGLGDELERKWSVAESHSLRELADEVNRRVVEAALRRAGRDPLDGEVENYYRLLADESAASGNRIDAVRRLERADVDVEDLTTDFVTYQSVRTYLQSERGVSYDRESPDPADRRERALDQIRSVEGRHRSVTASKLGELANHDALDVGEHEVSVSTTVFCEDCERPFDVDELIERGSCYCE